MDNRARTAPAPTRLVVRLPNWIGDAILAAPALACLADAGWQVELVGKGWAGSLMCGWGWPAHARTEGLLANASLLRGLRRGPRGAPAVCLPNSISSALELRLAGFAASGFANEGRSPLLGAALRRQKGTHTLERFWALAQVWLTPAQRSAPPPAIAWRIAPLAGAAVRERLAAAGVAPGYAVICPFGGTVDKQDKAWPCFPAFAAAWAARGARLVICPGPGEVEQARAQYGAVATVLDRVDLRDYAALLAGAAQVVANDTGPGHLAAAVGAPLVSVLGPTDPTMWAPWGPQVQVVRRWPQWPTVDEVLRVAAAQAGGVGSMRA